MQPCMLWTHWLVYTCTMELGMAIGNYRLSSIRFHATFVTCLVKYVKTLPPFAFMNSRSMLHMHMPFYTIHAVHCFVLCLWYTCNWNGHCWLVGRQSKANVSCLAAFLTSTYRLCCIAFTCSKLRITCLFVCFFGA